MPSSGNHRKRLVKSITPLKKPQAAAVKSPAKQVAVASASFPAGSPAITKADIVKEVSIKLRDLYKKGVEIFGNSSRFNTWLSRESAGLGSMQPLDLMGTSTGIDLVYEELLRIE